MPKDINNLQLTELQIKSVMNLYSSGKLNEAIAEIEKLNTDFPNVPLLFNILGACYQAKGLWQDSIVMFERAIEIKPDYAEAYFNLGVVVKETDNLDYARECYLKSIKLFPNYAAAHNNLGNIYKKLNQLTEAVKSYEKSVAIRPDFFEAQNNLGLALNKLGYLKKAEKCFRMAIKANNKHFDSHFNLANTLRDLSYYDQALESYENAKQINPDADYVLGNIIYSKMHLIEWSNLSKQKNNLINQILLGKNIIGPFALMALLDSPKIIKKATEIYVEERFSIKKLLPQIKPYKKHKKIRIGYFSGDFNNHPVSSLTAELYEIHDRNKFEVHAFSFKDKSDDMNQRIRQAVDFFHEVELKSDENIVNLARSLEIDIAIDLAGLTKGSRTRIFALSAAPIQISYIGYLGTMGSSYYDYIIADKVIIPKENQKYYNEKIIYLPNFQANDSRSQFKPTSLTRRDLGVPEKDFLFCCFNNTYKITPEIFDSWVKILKAVEGSNLFLYASNKTAEKNLTKEIIQRGVNPKRLFFGGKVPKSEYLARFKIADLFLDTNPYNAGTTASDALRMGLPILTFLGDSFASRMGASILEAVEIPDLIANNKEEYESLAIDLATDSKKLEVIRHKLNNKLKSSPLFNSSYFCQNLEYAYESIYKRLHKGQRPQHISV